MDGDVLLERAAGGLAVGQAGLRAGDLLARGVEPRVDRLLAVGLLREAALPVVGRRVELLKGDDPFQIGEHRAGLSVFYMLDPHPRGSAVRVWYDYRLSSIPRSPP